MPMQLEDYKEQLARHDWYYGFSDDPRVYNAGYTKGAELLRLAREKGDEWKKAYNEAHEKMFMATPVVTTAYKAPFDVS